MQSRLVVMSAVFAAVTVGCAGTREMEQPVGASRVLAPAEQRKVDDTARENAKLQVQTEELTNQLKAAREQIARTEQERKEMRDELLRMKIAQEEAQRARDRQAAGPPTRKEAAAPSTATEPPAALGDAELKRRLRDLVKELEELLQKR
jgi:septal ring factor EnvC (AmiA/AmiB activator)